MKKLAILLLVLVVVNLTTKGQTTGKKKRDLNENTVVTDSAGTRYPYFVWKKLLSTKEYRLKKVDRNSDSSAYLLVKLDSAQLDTRLGRMSKPKESSYFKDGDLFDFFNATSIDNYKIRSNELKGKIVVINFWFIGCPPCRKELPELNKIAIQYANDPDIVFIAVALDQRSDIEDFIQTSPFSYHIVDDGHRYANYYNIHLFPTNVVVGKDGKVRFNSTGYKANTPYWIKKTIEEAKKAG